MNQDGIHGPRETHKQTTYMRGEPAPSTATYCAPTAKSQSKFLNDCKHSALGESVQRMEDVTKGLEDLITAITVGQEVDNPHVDEKNPLSMDTLVDVLENGSKALTDERCKQLNLIDKLYAILFVCSNERK